MTSVEIRKSETFHIYENLALEDAFLSEVEPGTIYLFLWRNHPSVIIGKNQNPWRECNLSQMRKDGVPLARRRTGGGAVYHDLGNVNYSFLCREEDYDSSRFIGIVCEALNSVGISVKVSGRNDLVDLEGRKLSGTAFLQTGDRCLLHGTLLLDVDISRMEKYLTVSEQKLQSKGVTSVKSRVVNMKEYYPQLTHEMLEDALVQAVKKYFPCPVTEKMVTQRDVLQEKQDFYQSETWIFGRKIPFSMELSHRFPWGEIQIAFQVNTGKIKECVIYTDAMDSAWAERLAKLWKDQMFSGEKLAERADQAEMPGQICKDIKSLLLDHI